MTLNILSVKNTSVNMNSELSGITVLYSYFHGLFQCDDYDVLPLQCTLKVDVMYISEITRDDQ